MNLTLEDLLEYIHRFEIVDIRDQYGIEVNDESYGKCFEVFHTFEAKYRNLLKCPVSFIQTNTEGNIEIIINI